MGREYELKFRADPHLLDRIQTDFSGQWHRISMKTTYYDTPMAALSARKWTLRHRMENDTHICTLKTPAAGGARGEWETECADILEAVPILAEASGQPDLEALAADGLFPVCGAEFVRLARTFPMGDCMGEMALDQGVLRNGSRELPFAEIETELKAGSREALDAFGAELARTYGLQHQPRSKYVRARLLGMEE